jgi:hypothetical protein
MEIALDTRIIRDFGFTRGDAAFAALREVRGLGHRFRLADHAIVELVAQLDEGRFEWNDWKNARARAAEIVDRENPIIPGGWELFAGLGLPVGDRTGQEQPALRRDEAVALWERLLSARNPTEFRELWLAIVEGREMLFGFKRGAGGEMLEALRDGWITSFDKIAQGAALKDPDQEALVKVVAAGIDVQAGWDNPPCSVRIDSMIRTYAHLAVRRLKEKEPYDHRNLKKRNDGIDFDMLQYHGVPMLICVDDRKFTNAVAGGGSAQRAWMLTPPELAEACRTGKLPVLPNWPGSLART